MHFERNRGRPACETNEVVLRFSYMAVKRQKKAPEVSAKPAEAEVPPKGSAAPRAEVRATAGKVDTTRGDVAISSGKVKATRSEVAATSAEPAATAGETSSALDREQQIREQAYHIWKREGEPHGLDEHHWTLAEQFLQGKP
jgi:hypothetical protein